MSTIITLIGAAVLGLIVIIAVLWRRTHRELRDLRRELRATQQELEIQRIVVDQPDGPPQRRRHLRALIFLAPLLLWLREHRVPVTAIGAGAVGTVAAVAILTQAGAPSEPRQPPRAAPAEPFTPPSSSSSMPSPTIATPTHAPPLASATTYVPSPGRVPDRTSSTDASQVGSVTITTVPPTPTTTGLTPTNPPGELTHLCVEVTIAPLIDLNTCLLNPPTGDPE